MVYGCSELSPVKTQLIVSNSEDENEINFLLGKESHFHLKSFLNFALKKNCSAWKKSAVSTAKKNSKKKKKFRKLLFLGVSIRRDVQQYFMCLYLSISLYFFPFQCQLQKEGI